MNMYIEAQSYAKDLIQEAIEAGMTTEQEIEEYAFDLVPAFCDGLGCVIYYHQAIEFCARNNTNEGEQWLEDCGGIAQPGDSFGQIASRIAYATMTVAIEQEIREQVEQMHDLDSSVVKALEEVA